MQENTDKENNARESTEVEKALKFLSVPDNPSVSMTELQGAVLVTSEEEGCPNLEKRAEDLPRDEPTAEGVALYVEEDLVTIAVADGALEVSVPLSMIEELIVAYREETRRRIAVTG